MSATEEIALAADIGAASAVAIDAHGGVEVKHRVTAYAGAFLW